MATGYTRQSAAFIITGATIEASHHNNEYNAIETAFHASTGHSHDGTAGGGAPVPPSGLSGLSADGIVARTSSTNFTGRTLTGTANRITITNGTGVAGNPTFDIGTDVVTLTGSQTLTNKTITAPTLAVNDNAFTVRDNGDTTKVMAFELSGITTGTTRTLTVPNASGTIALTSDLTSGYQPLDADLTALAGMTTSGFVSRNNTGPAMNPRTLTGTTNRITITNGTGTGGDPVFDIGTDVVTLTGSQTLTNKTLTSPVIGTITNTGTLTLPTSTDTLVGKATTDVFTNKSFSDSTCLFVDNSDNTKKMAFELSGITTANTRTITVPNASGTMALTSDISALSSVYQPLDTDLTNVAALASSGFISRNNTGPAMNPRTITGDTGITVTNGDGTAGNPVISSNRPYNYIFNGGMRIAQNLGASVINGSSSNYLTDGFEYINGSGVWSGQFAYSRDTASLPSAVGITHALKFSINSQDATLGTTEKVYIRHIIEGNDCQDLMLGTANAATVTLVFWVRSPLTGAHAVAFRNSAKNRSYVATYSVSVADTWELKSVTVALDTTGTWVTDTGVGLEVVWDLGSGSNSNTTAGSWQAGEFSRTSGTASYCTQATSKVFAITGVGLYKGSTAPTFYNAALTDDLYKCQRRFYKTYDLDTVPATTTYTGAFVMTMVDAQAGWVFPVRYPFVLRTTPSVVFYRPDTGATGAFANSIGSVGLTVQVRTGTGGTGGFCIENPSATTANNYYGHITADARYSL